MEWFKEFIEIAESHPLGFLVVLLIAAVLWFVKKTDDLVKERRQLANALFHARQEGLELEDETTQVLSRIEKRKTVRKKK